MEDRIQGSAAADRAAETAESSLAAPGSGASGDGASAVPPGAGAAGRDRAPSRDPLPDAPPHTGTADAGPDETWPAGTDAAALSRRLAAARERIADFDAVALNPALPVSRAMAATIARSERGAEIAYHLGLNPDLAARIAGLGPLDAARELGRIEAQLTAAPKRAVTAAPPPLRPLGAGEAPRRDPDAMSYREYKAWRRTG